MLGQLRSVLTPALMCSSQLPHCLGSHSAPPPPYLALLEDASERKREREGCESEHERMFPPPQPPAPPSPLAGFVLSILACAWKHPSAQRVGFCGLRFTQLRKKTRQEREGILLDVPDNQFLIFLAKEQPEGELYHSAVGKLEDTVRTDAERRHRGLSKIKLDICLSPLCKVVRAVSRCFGSTTSRLNMWPSTHTLPTCE